MKPSPLTLRVMRLYKPKLRSEPHSFAAQSGQSAFALTPGLVLPENFGTIHLGQTFSSYVTVYNHSATVVRDVLLSSELITATKRVILSDERAAHSGRAKVRGAPAPTTPVAVTLQPGQNTCMVVRYQLNEKDVHTLNVLVSYKDHVSGEANSFRKYFRFKVVEPLQVGLKRVDLELAGRSDSFVEATFKNTSPSTLAMQSVSFKPAANYVVESLSAAAVGSAAVVLKTNDMHQYLFRVSPKSGDAATKAEDIGSVDIMWRGPMGEFGHLQTPPLKREAHAPRDVTVSARSTLCETEGALVFDRYAHLIVVPPTPRSR